MTTTSIAITILFVAFVALLYVAAKVSKGNQE